MSNIGSSGEDGVSMNLGEVKGFWLDIDPIYLGPVGVGTTISFDVSDVGFQNPAGTIEATADFSAVGATELLVEVLQDNKVVLSGLATSGSTVATLADGGFGLPRLRAAIIDNGDTGFHIDSFFDVFTEITVPGTGFANGNGLRMRATNTPFITFTGLEFRLDEVPTTTITDEAIRVFDGIQNRALGQAKLEAHGGTLTVSNIGSSGEDGVSIDLDYPISPWRVSVDPIALDTSGKEINFQINGVAGGTAGKLADFGLSRVNPHYVTFDDLSLVGSTEVLVEAFNGQTSLGSTVVAVGSQIASLTSTTGDPRLTDVKVGIAPGIGSSGEDGFLIDSFFDVFTELTVGSDIYPNVNHIRLTPLDPSESVDGFTDFGITGNGLGSFTLTQVVPEPSTFVLAALGLLGLLGWGWRRRR